MGLDVTAYSKIHRDEFSSEEKEDMETADGLKIVCVYNNPVFASHQDDLWEGFYAVDGDEFRFRAGSYSGYNFFRDLLTQLAHGITSDVCWKKKSEYIGQAFEELINFSDCEGCIGPKTSAKLFRDFEANKEDILTELNHTVVAKRSALPGRQEVEVDLDDNERKWFEETYDQFMNAFRIASDGGCVKFH